MKKLFFIIAGIFITQWCIGQIYVNHKNLSTSNDQYIEVWEKYNPRSGKFYAMIDYGQDTMEEKNGARLKVHDPNKNFLQFNNTIAILNYLHRNGWELVQVKKTSNIDSYLMKRRKEFLSTITKEPVNTTIGSIE